MQGKPLLRLVMAVVVKFVVDLPRPKGIEQITPDIVRELARMNSDGNRTRHAENLDRFPRMNKICFALCNFQFGVGGIINFFRMDRLRALT